MQFGYSADSVQTVQGGSYMYANSDNLTSMFSVTSRQFTRVTKITRQRPESGLNAREILWAFSKNVLWNTSGCVNDREPSQLLVRVYIWLALNFI